MSEDNKKQTSEQELTAEQLETVAGGLITNEVVEGTFKLVKAGPKAPASNTSDVFKF